MNSNLISLLPLLIHRSVDDGLDLPPDSENIFYRLIRDPRHSGRPMREVQCTEMLCAVMLNSPDLQLHILLWLNNLAGNQCADIEKLDWHIDTEMDAFGKRLDLKIEGFHYDASDAPSVLWIVEVKVQSGFHQSSDISGTDDDTEGDENLVNQIENYDYWLKKEDAEKKAGFVLSIKDSTDKMPEDLSQKWSTTTWTKLGKQIINALKTGDLASSDRLLALHLAGFINHYLWGDDDVTDERLELHDVAFLKAFNEIASDCVKKTERLVSQLDEVLGREDYGGSVTVKIRKKRLMRESEPHILAIKDFSSDREVQLQAGIFCGRIIVSLSTDPKHTKKRQFQDFCASIFDKLHTADSLWILGEKMAGMAYWRWLDIAHHTPLEVLLGADDQAAKLAEIVEEQLDALKDQGFFEGLLKIISDDE